MMIRKNVHYTELGPSAPDSPVAEEWETYRRIAGELLAAGRAGEHVLIRGTEVIGFWPTFREAHAEGTTRFPGQPIFVQEVREWEPVYFSWYIFGKLLKEEIAHAADDRPPRSRSADNSTAGRAERG